MFTPATRGAVDNIGFKMDEWAERVGALPLLAITPFERPDLALARAIERHGVAVAVDIGRNSAQHARVFEALRSLCSHSRLGAVGVRIPDHVAVMPQQLPREIGFVVLPAVTPFDQWRDHFLIIAQVRSEIEARAAVAAGASGLIAKGDESGGWTGENSAFVLLQKILALPEASVVPVWCQGGMGLYSAAAAIGGGARGIVLESQLALLHESTLPDEIKAAVQAMDGSETRVLGGYHIYSRPGTAAAQHTALEPHEVRTLLGSESLRDLLPIGQDAAFAGAIAAQYPTVETLLNGLRTRIAGQLRQAQQLAPLGESSPLARAHHTRFPIAQGPMTRVSDTAGFAIAVAENGALPFLALSLMSANAARDLLEQTRDGIGERSWGVGVLGFAPPEILDPHLELIREFRPSVVLLAGGRPSQARTLVELGIPTYLHVPSPGLLELFLKDGARHFIFEGRECGGHVGPRYSFVLWEQQLHQLLAFERPEELHVYFAGGIHDARSAAMVAVLAAPLAARGAKIGVLMGTAYIATAEAVRTGTIVAEFQRQTLCAVETTLIETAPGHAVRCLPGGFVEAFNAEKRRQHKQGIGQQQSWKELEAFNIGRLRIATKGVARHGDALVKVDLATQQQEGMYMIGQVAALCTEVQTMASLHRNVCVTSQALLDVCVAPPLPHAKFNEPIAIIGMGCIFPGSADVDSFWANILAGRDLISEVPAERWNTDLYYREGLAQKGKTPSKWGGFIDEIAFDPLHYGIPPQSLAAIEPVQLLTLEVARRALADAGYGEGRGFDREKTSVIFGAEGGMDLANAYAFRNSFAHYCGELPPQLDAVLPDLTEDSFPGVLSNVIAGRVANRLGLGGVNYSVDAACASSLTAIELAVKELRTGDSNMVLAGGADFHNNINDFLMFASVKALAPSGRCRSFDANADGICLGEGTAAVVLKRLSDAEHDGDRIYAVIEAVAGSSDGKGLGLTAPRKEGQKRALERAYWQAGQLPAAVGLVEAHGTGTVVGDRTELKTLTEIYNAGGAVSGQTALGSVKSQIGHTKCAAGIAGLIKVAKALHHRILPPTQHINTPTDWYRRANSPFFFNKTAQVWLDEHARGAVSAFGFGGTNFHVVLAAHQSSLQPDTLPGLQQWPAELFVFRGHDAAAAHERMLQLKKFLDESTAPLALRDLSFTVSEENLGAIQCAFVAHDTVDLRSKLQLALQGEAHAPIQRRGIASEGKVVFLFPGQGSQVPGMLQDIFIAFAQLRPILESGREWLNNLYPSTAYSDDEARTQQRALTDTRVAQPALGIVEYAMATLLKSCGVQPQLLAGHSYGELVALAVANVFDLPTLLKLSQQRGAAIVAAAGSDPGKMAAVSGAAAAIAAVLREIDGVELANHNSPTQTVISGFSPAMDVALATLKQHGFAAKPIEVACAFHSPVLARAKQTYADHLRDVDFFAPQLPVYSNTTTSIYSADTNAIKAQLARHIVEPVRFVEQLERMYADGARIFVEVGPGCVLKGFVEKTLAGKPHHTIVTDQKGRPGIASFLEALAQLAVLTEGIDVRVLYAGRQARRLDLNQPCRLTASTWLINGQRARPLQGELPSHAGKVLTQPLRLTEAFATPATPPRVAHEPEAAVLTFLNNVREMVNAQRDVMLSFLGQAPAASSVAPQRQPIMIEAAVTTPTLTPIAMPMPASEPSGLEETLLAIVGARTGYPVEMLDLDLDLEAELSIDSIKRVEIIGELSERLGFKNKLGTDADALLEQLAARKNLRAMLEWLSQQLPADTPPHLLAPGTAHLAGAASNPSSVADSYSLPAMHDVQAVLLAAVSERTGYPLEVLDLDLDLESDLSIDSIKRTEIIGELLQTLNIHQSKDARDAAMESLAPLKTLRAVIGWLQASTPAPGQTAVALLEAEDVPAFVPEAIGRFCLRSVQIDEPVLHAALLGKKFLVTDDGRGIAKQLTAQLERHGAQVCLLDFTQELPPLSELESCDGIIYLWGLHADHRTRDIVRCYDLLRQTLVHKVAYVIAASGLGGHYGHFRGASVSPDHYRRGAGLAGLIKSVAKEWPEIHARCVDLDLHETPAELARYLEQELLATDRLVEVAYRSGRRFRMALEATIPPKNRERRTLQLDENSVVLLTGGARGVTAVLAQSLARQYRCRLELIGRTSIDSSVDKPEYAAAGDQKSLRQCVLADNPGLMPAAVEKRCVHIMAEREIRATLAAIRKAGGHANYTPLDVRDSDRFGEFIIGLYESHGHIDGVIHGAGIIDDKLIRHKSAESFARVFDTKVSSGVTLCKLLRDDVKFVVFFSSVASAFGNRGQSDYAAANDVLDKLAHTLQGRVQGRVVSINWGPWAGAGMVSPELQREYARRGIGLIPLHEGIEAVLRELASGEREDVQVVMMCGALDSESMNVLQPRTMRARV